MTTWSPECRISSPDVVSDPEITFRRTTITPPRPPPSQKNPFIFPLSVWFLCWIRVFWNLQWCIWVVITFPLLVQEAAGGAGGSSHAERATEGYTATCTSQQSWWSGSGAGRSLLCPGDCISPTSTASVCLSPHLKMKRDSQKLQWFSRAHCFLAFSLTLTTQKGAQYN